jgi:hypothetical protein
MANKLEEWQRDLVSNVDDRAVRDIVNDLRSYDPSPSMGKAAKVTVQGAGVVKDADPGPAYRPYAEKGGWVEAPKVDSWRPPGIDTIDAMCSAQDAIDKAERIRVLAEAIRNTRTLVEAEREAKESQDKKES